jgi:hypothetical protein
MCLFGTLAVSIIVGCSGRPSSTSPGKVNSAVSDEDKAGIASAMEALHQGNDLKSCRNAIKQLNTYFARHPDQKPPPLSDTQRELLCTEYRLTAASPDVKPRTGGVESDELTEVASSNFTQLDAHHLEFCLLLRDAARALDVDDLNPLARATAAFDWVVRQVALQEGATKAFPPEFALRRGWGTSLERAMLFAAVLPQLGIEGCMVALREPDPARTAVRYWIPGALIDNDIYIFDTRLGIPLPGPNRKRTATLKQLRQQPELLKRLSVDEKHRYDVTQDQVGRAEIHVAAYLSALSPRMAHLEGLLASHSKVSLAIDPAALLDRFRLATKGQGIEVKVWNTAGEPNSPITVLRSFLPPEEGGIDKSHRKARAEFEVVPWDALPDLLARRFPKDTELGRRLRTAFQRFFVAFMLEPKPAREDERQRSRKNSARAQPDELRKQAPEDLIALLTAGSRDRMLHGRFEEATMPLVEFRDELRKLKTIVQSEPELQNELATWSAEFTQAYAKRLRAERAPPGSAEHDPNHLKQVRDHVAGVWTLGEGMLTAVMLGSASDQLVGVTTYFLALCKHEQAQRLQSKIDHAGSKAPPDTIRAANEAWKGAADWWETYLAENPPTVWTPTARLLRAKALLALGHAEVAVPLLQDLSGNMSALEQLGRLYRLQQPQTP